MDRGLTAELVVAPSDESVRGELAEAEGWTAYEAGLRDVFGQVLELSGADELEVGELLVAQPLPAEYPGLRNGTRLDRTAATDLVVRMVRGDGPYGRLSAPGKIRVESGWDGAVHLMVSAAAVDELTGRGHPHVTMDRHADPEEPEPVEQPVREVADAAFWAGAADMAGEAAGRPGDAMVLLRERWAHGAFGCRWFRLTTENAAALSRTVTPRSLVTVVCDPPFHKAGNGAVPPQDVLDDDLVAFPPLLMPGELEHRAWPGGVDDVHEVTQAGYSLVLAAPDFLNRSSGARHAVVPDPDGVVRMQWENPSAD